MGMLKRIKEAFLTKEYQKLFAAMAGISLGIYLLLSLLIGKGFFSVIYYIRNEDAFMDFFNSIRDSAQGMDAYLERKIIYPPMANMIFFLFSKLTSEAYNHTVFEDRYDWINYGDAIGLIVGFIAVTALVLAVLIFLSQKGKFEVRCAVSALGLCTVPFLNLFERGNLLSLCFLGLLVYMLCDRSRNAAVREIGLLFLSFAISLKLYPALFAWLLIGDRRWKDFIRVVVYSVILLILPAFAFGDPTCLLAMVENIFSFSSGSGGALGAMSRVTHLPQLVVNGIMYGWFLVAAAVFAVSPYVFGERWMVWMAGCVVFISYPPLTTTYAWILFVIPLLLMFREGMRGGKNLPYFLAMTIPFLHLCVPVTFHVTANVLAVYGCLLVLTVLLTRDALHELRIKKSRVSAKE